MVNGHELIGHDEWVLWFTDEEEFVGGVFVRLAVAEVEGVEERFVGELAVGDDEKLSAAAQRVGGGGDEGFAKVDIGGLSGVERRVHDDGVVGVG